MSWTDLVSKDTAPNDENNDDVMVEDEESSEDGFTNFDRNNTNFEKFIAVDYGEIDDVDDDEEKEKEGEDEMDGFNENDIAEDIECDEDEEEENGEFEMYDVAELDDKQSTNEMEMDVIREAEEEKQNDVFDENGNCKLTLDANDCLFYRHESSEDEMWKQWRRLKKKFLKARNDHKQWVLRRQQNKEIDKMLEDGNNDTNKKSKKRKLRDI